jgi:hypothetical protein
VKKAPGTVTGARYENDTEHTIADFKQVRMPDASGEKARQGLERAQRGMQTNTPAR